MLYYAGTVKNLRNIADKISRALEPGGFFVTGHAHLVVDEPHRPGFDWDLPFGAKRISDVFGACPILRLVRDLRTPLYRIQVYQRQSRLWKWFKRSSPKRTLIPQPTELPPHAAAHAHWQGGLPQRLQPAETRQTSRLPILMYHHVSPTGAPEKARYRVTPEMFESQLRALAARRFRCVSLEEWRRAMQARKPLSGRCVVLTFDDGYRDFLDHAWPALQRYGYSATVYLPTEVIANPKSGEHLAHDGFARLSWEEIRQLQSDGVEFGSHSVTHPGLTSLSPVEIAREALRSRIIIEEQLNRPITSFAYPFGETDRVVEAVVGSCGYTFGLTCEERRSEFGDRLMALPRLEIRGNLDLQDFDALLEEA
jgi:peptidoglycan/xylan/chitin deacetylase (PgdA/CDA1 family)